MLRNVTGITAHENGTIVLTLDCGHKARRPASQANRTRVLCFNCTTGVSDKTREFTG